MKGVHLVWNLDASFDGDGGKGKEGGRAEGREAGCLDLSRDIHISKVLAVGNWCSFIETLGS